MKPLHTLQLIILMALFLTSATTKSQDIIVTTKGKPIKAHVRKVKNGNIIYWKTFRRIKFPTYKALYIQYDNGTKTTFNNVTTVNNYKNYALLSESPETAAPQNDSLHMRQAPNAGAHLYRIERIGNYYRLDTDQVVGIRAINQIMAQSGNPAVIASLKAAKTMRMFTTISKIASFPGSASGGYASVVTFQNLFNQMKAGPAPFKYYLGAGLSFMATLTLPITSGILKHIQNKLYDKTLVLYSAGS